MLHSTDDCHHCARRVAGICREPATGLEYTRADCRVRGFSRHRNTDPVSASCTSGRASCGRAGQSSVIAEDSPAWPAERRRIITRAATGDQAQSLNQVRQYRPAGASLLANPPDRTLEISLSVPSARSMQPVQSCCATTCPSIMRSRFDIATAIARMIFAAAFGASLSILSRESLPRFSR